MESLGTVDGVLFYQWNSHDPKCLILPRRTVPQVIRQLHENLGQRRKVDGTSSKATVLMARNARRYRGCMQYLPAVRDVQVPNASSKGATIEAGFPNEIVGIDIMGPLPETSAGNRYILVIVNHFTKWATACPIRRADAITVAHGLMSAWVADFDVPLQLHSDRGVQFESHLMQELCRVYGKRVQRFTRRAMARSNERIAL